MILFYYIKSALSSILRAKLRSLLTILGIVIGISSVVAVIAVGNGLHAEIKKQMDVLGLKVLTVNNNPNSIDFTQQDLSSIEKIPNVSSVAPIIYVAASASYLNNSYQSAIITATTPSIKDIINQSLANGRYMTSADQNVAVIGSDVAASLFGQTSSVGKNITLTYLTYNQDGAEQTNTATFQVIGVYKKLSNNSSIGLSSELDGGIFIPESSGIAINGNHLNISTIFIKTSSSSDIQQVTQAITSTLTNDRGKSQGFTITNAKDIVQSYNNTLTQVTSFIAAVAGISLLVGGIGIMNIMLSSVSERTREIGIRRAIGASHKTILMQFLVESLILTTIGGILGVICSFGLAYIASLEIKIAPVFTLQAYVIGVSIAIVTGLVFGAIPAVRASKSKPIDALRHD